MPGSPCTRTRTGRRSSSNDRDCGDQRADTTSPPREHNASFDATALTSSCVQGSLNRSRATERTCRAGTGAGGCDRRLEWWRVSNLSEKLFALDDRVLHITRRREELRTPEGWRRNAERWRWVLAIAVLLGTGVVINVVAESASGLTALPLFGLACFRAGALKAEADRLAGRGPLEKYRPPGV